MRDPLCHWFLSCASLVDPINDGLNRKLSIGDSETRVSQNFPASLIKGGPVNGGRNLQLIHGWRRNTDYDIFECPEINLYYLTQLIGNNMISSKVSKFLMAVFTSSVAMMATPSSPSHLTRMLGKRWWWPVRRFTIRLSNYFSVARLRWVKSSLMQGITYEGYWAGVLYHSRSTGYVGITWVGSRDWMKKSGISMVDDIDITIGANRRICLKGT